MFSKVQRSILDSRKSNKYDPYDFLRQEAPKGSTSQSQAASTVSSASVAPKAVVAVPPDSCLYLSFWSQLTFVDFSPTKAALKNYFGKSQKKTHQKWATVAAKLNPKDVASLQSLLQQCMEIEELCVSEALQNVGTSTILSEVRGMIGDH